MSLIPKSIEDRGKALSLGDVKWSESTETVGEGNPITRYTATASRYATGYTVSANYIGEVSNLNSPMILGKHTNTNESQFLPGPCPTV